MDKLLIDFFEFQVLVEAAWYSGTILRHSIMQKAINVWYKHLSENERERTYDFFLRTKEDEIKLEIQKRFMARYNPNNQYKVFAIYNGEEQIIETYLFNDKYWISETTQVAQEYIIKVEKIEQLGCVTA